MSHKYLSQAARAAVSSSAVAATIYSVEVRSNQSYAQFKTVNKEFAAKAFSGFEAAFKKELGSNAAELLARSGADLTRPETCQPYVEKAIAAGIAWHFANEVSLSNALKAKAVKNAREVSRMYSGEKVWNSTSSLFSDLLSRATLARSNFEDLPEATGSDCIIHIDDMTCNITVRTVQGDLHFVVTSMEEDGLLMFVKDPSGKSPLVQIDGHDGFAIEMITNLQKARGEF